MNHRQQQQLPYTTPSAALQVFINKTLRVTTTDGRFFVGELKCTDRDRNIILAATTEYRYPSGARTTELESRFIGLVVVPGNVITKLELEDSSGERMRPRWGFGMMDSRRTGIV